MVVEDMKGVLIFRGGSDRVSKTDGSKTEMLFKT